jgi:hypothetical protein
MAINIEEFVKTRIAEYNPKFETRTGTPYGDLFIKPTTFIYQPFVDVFNETQINQSLRRILELSDPDAYNEEIVDDFGANLFVERRVGSKSRVQGRIFYTSPVDRDFPTGTAILTSSAGLQFVNYEPFAITAATMAVNRDGSLYYFDINVEAAAEGAEYNLLPGDLVSISGDADAISVTNLNSAYVSGSTREKNTAFIDRTKASIGVRDLNVGKGINGILFEKFPYLEEIRAIGFKDPEMMRDIRYNAHFGAHTDIYLKTPELQIVSEDIVGLVFDTTREIKTNLVKQIPNLTYDEAQADLGNPFIVSGSIVVTENDLPLPAAINTSSFSFSGGDINYGASSNRYIKLQVDSFPPVNIKVSGAISNATTLTEVIGQVNAATGYQVMRSINSNTAQIKSLVSGSSSQIIFSHPDSPRLSALTFLFGALNGGTRSCQFFGAGSYLSHSVASNAFLFLKNGASGLVTLPSLPAIGDHFVVTGAGVNSGARAVISSVVLVNIAGTDYYEITTDLAFNSESGPVACQFYTLPVSSVIGFVPVQPLEGIDFEVNYADGKIKRLPSVTPTRILSGQTVEGPRADGSSTLGQAYLDIPIGPGGFIANRVDIGDRVFITGGSNTGLIGKSYLVVSVYSDSRIVLEYAFKVDVQTFGAGTSDITFNVTSNKVYSITYKYNPISVDIGNMVALDADAKTRGIRPGRDAYTLTKMAYIDMISVEEIDPDTKEGLGVFLQDSLGATQSGYGRGPYGRGPYGIGNGSPFYYRIFRPHERFSAFEDGLIAFRPELFGKSYRFTYYSAPEIVTVHNFCRSDNERVTCADILTKNFIPAFVNLSLEYRVDTTDITVPSNEALTQDIRNAIESLPSNSKLESSDIVQFFTQSKYIKLPFKLQARVVKQNGSTEILASNDYIQYPTTTLASETDDTATPRTIRFYPGNIVLTRIT